MEVGEATSKIPVTWKPLPLKNNDEDYFVGSQKKKNKSKVKRKPPAPIWNQKDLSRGESLMSNNWSHDEVKEIFPQLKHQQELLDDIYEEVNVLSLEDLRVHTKRVLKQKPVDEISLNAADFPSVGIVAGVNRGGNIKAEQTAPITKSFSMLLKKLPNKRESNGFTIYSNYEDIRSTCCQTDHLFFTEGNSDANFKYLCANLPPDLHKILFDFLFERDELKRLLVHLLKLICTTFENHPEASSVPLRTSLSSSEKALILSQIF